jgi:hypothetical protein
VAGSRADRKVEKRRKEKAAGGRLEKGHANEMDVMKSWRCWCVHDLRNELLRRMLLQKMQSRAVIKGGSGYSKKTADCA